MAEQNMPTCDLAHLKEVARAAKSPEELVDIARSEGVELSHDRASEFFDALKGGSTNQELSDEELDNVSGGCSYPPDPRTCSRCGSTDTTHFGSGNIADNGYLNMVCRDCEYCWRIM